MKLKIVSPSQEHAAAWRPALLGTPGVSAVEVVIRPLLGVNALVNGSQPDLVVVETTNAAEFEALERLALTHPELQYVLVAHELTPDILMRAMRAGVREALPMPVTSGALCEAVQRLSRKRTSSVNTPHRHGEVLALLSRKGGSGATFVAANLAHILSQREGARVALIDLNLQFGDAALFVSSEKGGSHVDDVARNISRLDADLLQSSMTHVGANLWVLPAPEDPARGSDVQPQHVEAIVQLAKRMFDFVVIDAGRSLSAVTLKALDLSDRIYPVLQLTLPFIRDARRLRDVFASLDYAPRKIEWIVNRFQKGGDITLDDLKKALAADRIVTLPNQYDVVASSVNQGVPVDRLAPGSAITRALRELAVGIAPNLEPARSKGLFGVFRGPPQKSKGSDA